MISRWIIWISSVCAALGLALPAPGDDTFVNFESIPLHPLDLSPDHATLAVANTPAGRVDFFDITSTHSVPVSVASVSVGLDPVSVRFRNHQEVWVVNHISDSISIVALGNGQQPARVVATLDTLDTPSDLVFAGSPTRAFVTCARPNRIQIFDPESRQLVTNLVIDAERPKALATSPDGLTVYAAIFESGNGTTLVGPKFKNQLFVDNVVALSNAPSAGQNPAFNSPAAFQPPLNPAIPTNPPPPGSGIIVRKSEGGRWLDDQQQDWTEFVSGTNAALTQRARGWDLPDHDLAVVDTSSLVVRYETRLMNICMAIAANPVSGQIAVVGTDARNEVRFEPNLNGRFARVKLALVDPNPPQTGVQPPQPPIIRDLNPHIDPTAPTAPDSERERSIGDPRAVLWSADGTTAYVAGLGSRNLVVLDATGARQQPDPIEVGEGPCGLALDASTHRLYVYHRFSSSLSIVDTTSKTVTGTLTLFDPTPLAVGAGRRHLYDTRRTSGSGELSCATCHVDARLDRLAWDLGNPAGDTATVLLNQLGAFVTNEFHPMKGAMLTQTLQDIIGHEPFHWRGDRADIAAFNPTFTNLQGRPDALTDIELAELRDFLASLRLPPNPFRNLDNTLPAKLPLPDHVASGLGTLPAGSPLPNGNALAGVTAFNRAANFCNTCHTLPTGLGVDVFTNGTHHHPVSARLEGSLRAKNAQFRNLADRIGMDGTSAQSRAGFGFGHDGSIDTLTRFLAGLRIVDDQETADLIALLLSVAGSDLSSPGGEPDSTPPAAVGRQLTLTSGNPSAPEADLLASMLTLAGLANSRVDLIAKGVIRNEVRGFVYDRERNQFQSDRAPESLTPAALLALAQSGQELTLTMVPRGSGRRLGIDQDLDGALDRDELDAGGNPADQTLRPAILADQTEIPIGGEVVLVGRVPPLPGPGTLAWFKDGELLAGATNSMLRLTNVTAAATGAYTIQADSGFQSLTSAPIRITAVPLVVDVSPRAQAVRPGSNALFSGIFFGPAPSEFQWQFNGLALAGAIGGQLMVTNVQLSSEGAYRLIAANTYGRATSAPVRLGVLINPSVVISPASQAVTPGATATFAFQIAGHPPPFGFQLRRSTTLVTNYVSDRPIGFLSLFNVQPAAAGTYRIIVTNAANPSPGLSIGPVTVSLLADFDHDGLPDAWEIAHGLSTNNPADASFDLDHDGLSNLEEYLAGTDPTAAASALRIDNLFPLPGSGFVLQFNAAGNHAYVIQTRPDIDPSTTGPWEPLAEILNGAIPRTISFTNIALPTNSAYFRIATP